ncbi:MAG: DNA mismatch repair protein MutS [Candidatus Omnitrophica bacterium]|nr:DNA mismatch repair protein MutS [Candidatus Omnitrophota bacterium]MDD5487369.1 DNA mismatch repair protein MutS [Candidatus Omnitrophota bacterium]
MESDLTPMMRQYLDIKEKNRDAILFFRLGDFYEMFFDDAVEASRILHITLTSRGTGKTGKIPMCGIPHHAASNYIARLIHNGRKVAICEQVEEPGPGKKLVERAITRIITPGTFIADEILDGAVNNYILAICARDGRFGLAYADLSTGEFKATEIPDKESVFPEMYKISPSELLMQESFISTRDFKDITSVNTGSVSIVDDWMFDHELSAKELKRQFSVNNLEGFGLTGQTPAVNAAGALLKYLKNTQKIELNNIDRITVYNVSEYMVLDRNSQRHLELIQNQDDLSTKGTLYDVLDMTTTPMGKRKLKKWVLNPMLDYNKINERLDAVGFFFSNADIRKKVRTLLSEVYDIERLSNKVSMASANARDLLALASSLESVEKLKHVLNGELPSLMDKAVSGMDDFSGVTRMIRESIVDNPPVTIKEGGIIKKGHDAELDELLDIVSGGKDWITGLQKKEIERTGISSLKVGYNRVFGYYIEVTKANLKDVPDDYMRKQTLVNAERFITEELKEHESRIVGAADRSKNMEYSIFCGIRDEIGRKIDKLKELSEIVAGIDVISDLAEVAVVNGYNRPVVSPSSGLEIRQGRHPVLEKILKDKEFVPNDVRMDDDNRIFIITGSNMAGKSTFIRQVALITIMAQMGSFVPADEARIGLVDRVFTRVGASDRLYHGMSTFMVEMIETANILNNATAMSLIILDEIGRGTSTFDGVSIAWSVVEFIHHYLMGAKAMFATHYHELTELAGIMEGVKNYHLEVQEWGEDIVFLYKVAEGVCDESFGIHVARLAGMPQEVVARARSILANLQKDSLLGSIRSKFAGKTAEQEKQLDFFTYNAGKFPLLDEIKGLDLDRMTPIDALSKLSELKNKAEGR